MTESMVQRARDAHRFSCEADRLAAHHRRTRDNLIRQLHASGRYSYSQLAGQIGCSPELIAKIVQQRGRRD